MEAREYFYEAKGVFLHSKMGKLKKGNKKNDKMLKKNEGYTERN